jgi:hypothetical protein
MISTGDAMGSASQVLYLNGVALQTKTDVAIDDFRVLNRALSADEIAALYQFR